jgi:hypothetical protein
MEKISATLKIDHGTHGKTVELIEKTKESEESTFVLFEKMTRGFIAEAQSAGIYNVSTDQIKAVRECAQVVFNRV